MNQPKDRPSARALRGTVVALAAAAVVACRAAGSGPAPLPPPVRVDAQLHLGTPLSGPQSPRTEDVVAEGRSWTAHARFGFAASEPPADLPLLSGDATLVTDASRAAPVRSVPSATAAARRGSVDDPLPADLRWIDSATGQVVPDATLSLSLAALGGADPLVAVEYHVPIDGSPVWALVATSPDGAVDRLLLDDPPTPERGSALLWLPDAWADGFASIVVETWIGPTADDAGPATATSAFAQPVAAEGLELEAAVEATAGARPRAALVLLADRLGSVLAGDFALVADDELITAALDRADLAGTSGEDALGLRLDAAILLLLAERRSADELEASLDAVLLRHTGELGRLPSALGDAVRAAGGRAALAARLVSENRLLLEDPDPGARRRALQWLSERGAAPADFDPLASGSERRAALSLDAERRAAAARETERQAAAAREAEQRAAAALDAEPRPTETREEDS